MFDNKYMIKGLLGVGGSSRVYEAEDADGNKFAIKVITSDKPSVVKRAQDLVLHEYITIKKFDSHSNILGAYECNPEGVLELNGKQWDARYIVLEKCSNGSLARIIRNTGPIEESLAQFLFLQLCFALEHICNEEYAHLDIKLENILLDEFFNLKLADLGTARNVRRLLGYTTNVWGTPGYMAPEITSEDRDDTYDAYSADIYSLGVWLHIMLTGEFPMPNQMKSYISTDSSFDSWDSDIQKSPKLNADLAFSEKFDSLSEEAQILLEDMLWEDPWNRPSIFEILKYDWVMKPISPEISTLVYQEMNSRLIFIRSGSSQ